MCGRAKWLLLILKKQLSWFSNFVVVLVVLVVVLTDQTTETTLFVSSNLQMIIICKKNLSIDPATSSVSLVYNGGSVVRFLKAILFSSVFCMH